MTQKKLNLRKLNLVLHRDIGYFFSGLIIIYCVSGIALNHVDDWNPDFIITRSEHRFTSGWTQEAVTDSLALAFSSAVGEQDFKIYDFPTPSQLKIYFQHSSLLIDLTTGVGHYERIARRSVIFESNLLHRNSITGWKWAADIFSVMLIAITLTGLCLARGKKGFRGRGKWFVLAGMVPPVAAIFFFQFIQQ